MPCASSGPLQQVANELFSTSSMHISNFVKCRNLNICSVKKGKARSKLAKGKNKHHIASSDDEAKESLPKRQRRCVLIVQLSMKWI